MYLYYLLCILLYFFPILAYAETTATRDVEFDKILSLDIDELVVTSVSKAREKASTAAAAIYVISQEDLHRAGVTSIPEALRMVPGVDVAQINSHAWDVSIHNLSVPVRGPNNQFANKLLVLVDGRSVYTPIFSKVYWNMEDLLIADIDRIEVIRGPGSTLWGANAVNGVINIVRKNAVDTQGKYLSLKTGSEEYLTAEGRYGNTAGEDGFYRVYAKKSHAGKTKLDTKQDGFDDWRQLSSGFRIDKTQPSDSYTLQGDISGGNQGELSNVVSVNPPFLMPTVIEDEVFNSNILARWESDRSDTSHTTLQTYLTHYSYQEMGGTSKATTADIDFQNNVFITPRNNVVWGTGGRYISDEVELPQPSFFQESSKTYSTVNFFIQNQYSAIPEKLLLTAGSKFEHNDFTGYELQPSARFSYKPTYTQTIWGAISRAVRVPSRAEFNLDQLISVIPDTSTQPINEIHFLGSEGRETEKLVAYQLGYRLYPSAALSIDINGFYNDYKNLVTANRGTPFRKGNNLYTPLTLNNNGEGYTYGTDLSTNWSISDYWKIAASYSYISLHINSKGEGLINYSATERSTPHHYFSLRSYTNIKHNIEWDNMFYFVDDLPDLEGNTLKSTYKLRFDTRVGWKPYHSLELSITGRNLFNTEQPEYIYNSTGSIGKNTIGASVIGAISWTF